MTFEYEMSEKGDAHHKKIRFLSSVFTYSKGNFS